MTSRLIASMMLVCLASAVAHAETRIVPDTYATIDAALAAASAGDRIYIKRGTYSPPVGGWKISKSLEIFGDGPGGAVFAGTPGTLLLGVLGRTDPILVIDVDGNPDATLRNVYIHDLQIVQDISGGIPAPPSSTNCGIYCKITSATKNLGHLNLARVYVYGMGGDGIHLEGLDGDHNPQSTIIEDCKGLYNSNHGLYMLYAYSTMIRGGNYDGNFHKGIYASGCPALSLVGTVAQSNEHTGAGVSADTFVPSQIFLEGCNPFTMTTCWIEGFTQGGTNSLVGVAINCNGGYMAGNTFTDNSATVGGTGIYVGYTSSAITIGPSQFINVDKLIEVADDPAVKSCVIFPQTVPSYSSTSVASKIVVPEAADRGHIVLSTSSSGLTNLTAGVAFPRLAGATRDAMTAASSGGTRREGLVIYNDAAKVPNYFNGSAWTSLVPFFPTKSTSNAPSGGIAFPLVASTTRDSLPAGFKVEGAVIFNKTTHEFNYWNGSNWRALSTKAP